VDVARASATVELAGTVDAVWQTVTDFRRYPEWVAFHKQWVEDPPTAPAVGATLRQSVVILGPPAVVDWEIVTVEPGELLELVGKGATGVESRLSYRVAGAGDGAVLTVDMELSGGPVVGPIGDMIESAAQGLVDTSVRKFPLAG
jgi:hypothetical protein